MDFRLAPEPMAHVPAARSHVYLGGGNSHVWGGRTSKKDYFLKGLIKEKGRVWVCCKKLKGYFTH